mgnify:FL=1
MEREYILNKTESVTVNITGGKIDSFRKKNETTSTLRLYDGGFIGIAGALGTHGEDGLEHKAKESLERKIPYVCSLDGKEIRREDFTMPAVSDADFIPVMQDFIDRVSRACPNFAISHKITKNNFSCLYKNSLGRELFCKGNSFEAGLLFQSRGSGNLMDAFYGEYNSVFEPDRMVADCKNIHDAFYCKADIENGTYPVIFTAYDMFATFLRNFSGEEYVSGGSLLSGKLGQKVFSEKLNLASDRNAATNPESCFFDDEGQTAENDRVFFVENGVLKHVTASKNSAKKFGIPVSKTSVSAYDGVPAGSYSRLYVSPTAESLAKLVPQKAILAVMASGGDTTPDGHFVTPVQLAFLVENGVLVGRLPELNVSGDFFDMLGSGFVGAANSTVIGTDTMCAAEMRVEKM